jgi:hypothetical protein
MAIDGAGLTVLSGFSTQNYAAAALVSRGKTATVLTPTVATDYATTILLSQLSDQSVKALNLKTEAVSAEYGSKINAANRELVQWQDVSKELEAAVSFLSEAVGRSKRVQKYANDMITQAYSARNGDSTSATTYASLFDSLNRSLQSEAGSSSQNPNLLGSVTQRSYTYTIDISGATETVTRFSLASDYEIVDNTGATWKKKSDSPSILRQYDSSGAPTGLYGNVTTGLRLDSKSGSSINFTYLPGTGDEQSFSGTLTTSGLDILDSWLYEGLATTAGRTRALSDVHAAKGTIDAQVARLEGALATAKFYRDSAGINAVALKTEADSQLLARSEALKLLADEQSRQLKVQQTAVNNSALVRKQYFRMLAAASAYNKFTRALIDVQL